MRLATRLRLSMLCVALLATSCASAPVTKENSPEGRIAVYATKVDTAVDTVSATVKKLEAAGTLPTAQAGEVVKVTAEIHDLGRKLADVLKLYDALKPGDPQAAGLMGQVQKILDQIGALTGSILVPISNEATRKQISDLVGAVNQAVIAVSLELAKGVK